MPYTLMKALAWLLVALVLGIVIGWLLRNATARRQIARARGERGDAAELERLRTRSDRLDAVSADRDRLAAELEACRNERDRLAGSSMSAATPGETDGASAAHSTTAAAISSGDEPTATAVDVDRAAAVLGHRVEVDDLTEIEGIGPKIDELCHGIGIRTWGDLASTEVSLLRTMLTDAGARYKVHDPTTWPEQAALLAAGRWDEFKAYTDRVRGGDVESS